VVTTDAIVEGVHSARRSTGHGLARKALRVNLSIRRQGRNTGRLYAGAGVAGRDDACSSRSRGLGEDAAQFGCPLLGGDTVSTPGPT
jgi:thiamine-monophosphate kinase